MKPNESAKPAGAPAPRSKEPDIEETANAPAQQRTGLLPTGLSRAMVIGSILLVAAALAIGLFGDRYTLIAASRSENALAYRLDRVTGKVSFCSPASCVPLAEKSEAAK